MSPSLLTQVSLSALSSLLTAVAGAQGSTPVAIVAGNDHISVTFPDSPFPGSPFNEVVVAGHPTDARRILACSMLEPGANRSVKSAAWVSSDGGRTWSPPLVTTAHWANDPTCAWGPTARRSSPTRSTTATPRPKAR